MTWLRFRVQLTTGSISVKANPISSTLTGAMSPPKNEEEALFKELAG
jgi:hypothetical protein